MTATHPLGGKTTLAIGVMLGLLAVPYVTPRLAALRVSPAPWDRSVADAVAAAEPEHVTSPVLTLGEARLEASKNEANVTNALPDKPSGAAAPPPDPKLAGHPGDAAGVGIEDAGGHALDAFFAQLQQTRSKTPGAVTRILHYGDSVITSDYVSGTMRRRMQAAYGDAGHGFILTANPWEWYFHNDVVHGAGTGWSSSRVVGPLTNDGMYGLGGVTFTGGTGATAWFATSDKSSYGKKVSRFDVYYLETPGGGDVEVKVTGGEPLRFSTKGETKVSRVKSVSVADGEARLSLKVASGAPRIFGVALERDVPGVVYDALGANGARAELWNGMNEAHWGEQMALRKPALVILQFGTNESEAPGIAPDYERTLRAVVDKLKAAAKGASILIASPLDRAESGPDGLRTKPVLKKLVAAQRNVAKDANVAFFSTFDAMGGEGSMAKWVKKGLAGSDLTHPSPHGAELIGDMLHRALTASFDAWVARGGHGPTSSSHGPLAAPSPAP